MFPPSDDEEEGSSSWREKMPPLPKFLNPTSLFAGKNTKDREYAQHRTRTPLSTERNQRDWEGVTLRRADREGNPYEHTNYATEARFTPSGQINQPGRYVLTMSKLSLWSVAFGLFFLGVLFFGGGFIVALSLLSATPQMLSSTDHGVSIHSAVARGGALIPIDQGKQIPQKAAPLALQTPQTGEIPSVAPAPTPCASNSSRLIRSIFRTLTRCLRPSEYRYRRTWNCSYNTSTGRSTSTSSSCRCCGSAGSDISCSAYFCFYSTDTYDVSTPSCAANPGSCARCRCSNTCPGISRDTCRTNSSGTIHRTTTFPRRGFD
jgi:hypothetical protein